MDRASFRWQTEFALVEANCFDALYEFVRVHFGDLIGHASLIAVPSWAFERYLREAVP
jgi:hypothetical protein